MVGVLTRGVFILEGGERVESTTEELVKSVLWWKDCT